MKFKDTKCSESIKFKDTKKNATGQLQFKDTKCKLKFKYVYYQKSQNKSDCFHYGRPCNIHCNFITLAIAATGALVMSNKWTAIMNSEPK